MQWNRTRTPRIKLRQWGWEWLRVWILLFPVILLNSVPQLVPQQARLTDPTPHFLILQSSYYSYYILLRLTDYASVLILLYASS